MKSIKRSGLLLAALLIAVLAMTSMVMARESESATQTQTENGDALAIALAHLQQNKASLGLTAADLAEAKVTDTTVSRLSGVTTIYLGQQLGGIEVFNGLINISVMPNGEILMVGNRFVPDLAGSVSERTASISAEQAVNAAAAHLDLALQSPLQTIEQASGPAQETLFSDGGISQNPIPAKLVYDASGKAPRLAWNVIIYQLDSQHWWNVRIDANSGTVLSQNDWVVSENFDAHVNSGHNAVAAAPAVTNAGQEVPFGPTPVADGSSYQVYHLPIESPSHSSPPTPADGRTLQNTPADAGGGSPFGWHDTNGAAGAEFTTTQGNNAHAYTDTNDDDLPDPGSSPDGGAGLDFVFPLDLTLAPSAYRPAAVTNLFHWNNLMHDVNYRYGFDEVHGNFQENNYGNGGLGSDYVNAEAQDGGGTNNANFATPTDGQNPRMQMYIWTAPTPDRDGDLDNGIIAHEYGHGISNRMVGGPSNVGCLGNSEQMGEGWSDWQSVIMTMRTGDTGTTTRGVGTYALNQPTTGVGIRPAPYTTDITVNTYTYGDLPSMAVPHGVGFVWNTMLWEMNWGLIDAHGFNEDLYLPNTAPSTWSGNQLAHALVTEGFNLTPCSPGFVDGRNAILAADVALTGGENACTIWTAFAKRGLGFSASQGSSNSSSDGTEAFDMPAACLTLDVTPLSNDICQGDTAVYTVGIGTAFTPPVTMSATGNPAPSTATYNPNPVVSVPSSTDLTIGNTGSVAAGSYTINIAATDGTVTDNADVTLNVFAGTPGATTLVSPINGANGVATQPEFEWTAVTNASGYSLEVATDPGFSNIVYTANEAGTTHTAATALDPDTQHYWRVTSENSCGTGTTSSVFTFRTAAILTVCRTPALPIPDDPDVSDTMVVAAGGTIEDMNVSINANHTWVGDLTFTLTHQDSGTSVTMIDRPGYTGTGFGCSGDNIDAELDDEGTDGPVENQCSNAPALFGSPTPNNPLSAFDGDDASGTWILSISDGAGGDIGTLNEWCMIASVPPTGGPSIDMEKTVSTDGSCGTLDNITVDYGTDVTYCYDVTNTGDITFTLHDLVDDQLGILLDDFAYDLAPGASVFITETVTMTETTVNTATWTATDGSLTAGDVDSATVTVVVNPTIDVDPDSVSTTMAPDTTDTETLTISNIGTGNLDWTITEDSPTTFGSQSNTASVVGLPAVVGNSSAAAAETVDNAVPAVSSNDAPAAAATWAPSGGILYDNGTLVNSPGTGPGGSDESLLQDTSLLMTIFGFGHQIPSNNSMADDFTVTGSPWTVDSMVFYAYQTGSTTTSTITGYNVNIYDGDPSSGGTVIASSSTIVNSEWSGIYRGLESAPGNTQRPIMATTIDFGGLVLAPGTYWVEWQAAGSLASGPWAPPITINGQTTTGNGLQNLAGTWGAAIDVGQQGFPFLVLGTMGSVVCSTPSDVPWLSVSPDTGTTGTGASSDVTVSFDSTGLTAGNTYTATLCVESNDAAMPLVTVPVTMTIVAPTYALDLSGDDAATSLAGTTVTYTMQVTNNSNVADVIDLAVSDNVWTTTLSDSSLSLNAGESATFWVWVEVPGDAADGDMDMAMVTATSQGDNSVTDMAHLTTTAEVVQVEYLLYLPVIMKP